MSILVHVGFLMLMAVCAANVCDTYPMTSSIISLVSFAYFAVCLSLTYHEGE